MKPVKHAGLQIIRQLHEVIDHVSDDDFTTPVEVLGHSTIGQHCRHIIEFFECLESGILSGTVNYDHRKRSLDLETNRMITLSRLCQTENFISGISSNAEIKLESGFDQQQEAQTIIISNVMRELAFTIDHAIHHMALIKAGLRYISPEKKINSDFGVAFSTLRHQKTQAPAAHQI